MKRPLLTAFAFVLCMIAPAICQQMPKDVKRGDPYFKYVKDLNGRGIDVTQGFPDGTFRGNNFTTNYEAAYLVAKMAISLKSSVTSEIDVSDIRDEINWLRNEVKVLNDQPQLKSAMAYYGNLDLTTKFGNVFGHDPTIKRVTGPEMNYRLKYAIEKEMGEDANIRMNIDTMDGAFNSNDQRGFPLKIMDIEGNATADMGLEKPVKIKVMMGPGSVKHTDTTGVLPVENGTYFARPRPTFLAATSVSGFDIAGMYAGRSISSFGRVGTSEMTFLFGRKVGQLPFLGTTEIRSISRYVCVDFMNPPSAPNNFHEELGFYVSPNRSFSHKLILGSSSSNCPKTQYYLNYECTLKDFNAQGVKINFIFHSVGLDYRLPFEKLEFLPLNIFNRKILDGTMDIALEVYQPLSSRYMLVSRTDWVGNAWGEMGPKVPGSSFIQELSLEYTAGDELKIRTFYRYYSVPSRLDQYMTAVPETSDCLGFGATFSF